jgi:3alpha(or 20beta)-hydroxysteroid dehydrogenase
MARLKGKVAIVTGAARGTGEAAARRFSEEGARVLLGDIRDELGAAVAEDIGDAAHYQRLDVTDERDWERAVALAQARFGGIDILVNNAALLDVRSIAETSAETFRKLLLVNQLGPFLGTRSVIEAMKARGGGSIVNVSSIDGLEGSNGVAAYTSTKWGLRGFTKAACQELGRYCIRVNTLCPNPGSREMTTPFVQEAVERLKARSERLPDRPIHPFGRRGKIADVVDAMVFLASDDSAFVSGCDLPVDGGWTAGKIEPGAPTS